MNVGVRIALSFLMMGTVGAVNQFALFQGHCPRCVSSVETRKRVAVPLPKRAIFYFRMGEFAHYVTAYVIDLDTGEVSTFNVLRGNDVTRLGYLSSTQLADIRNASARAWHLKPPRIIHISPGTDFELNILNGERMAPLEPDEDDTTFLTAVVDADLNYLSEPN